MLRYLARRLIVFGATLLVASLLVFLALEVLPGDPARVMLGVDADSEAVAALRRELGLDRPAALRYLAWLGDLALGRLGQSYAYDVPVGELVAERLQVTAPLALLAILLSLALALVFGLYAAGHHRRPGDWAVMGLSQIGVAVPNFWLGLILVLVFAVHLRWLPAGGFPGWREPSAAFAALALPAIALATVQGAILTRLTRAAALQVIGEDYVRTAYAKGLTPGQVMRRHVLRNALIPVVTLLGLQFASLLAGTIVVENVFRLPGLGLLVFQAIGNRDLPVVRDVVLMLAALVVALNLLVDLAYAVIDPRLERARP